MKFFLFFIIKKTDIIKSLFTSMIEASKISYSSNLNQLKKQQYSESKYEKSTEGGQSSSRGSDSKSNSSKASALNSQILKI